MVAVAARLAARRGWSGPFLSTYYRIRSSLPYFFRSLFSCWSAYKLLILSVACIYSIIAHTILLPIAFHTSEQGYLWNTTGRTKTSHRRAAYLIPFEKTIKHKHDRWTTCNPGCALECMSCYCRDRSCRRELLKVSFRHPALEGGSLYYSMLQIREVATLPVTGHLPAINMLLALYISVHSTLVPICFQKQKNGNH